MTGAKGLDPAEIRAALAELDAIARDEYGPKVKGLDDLLADPTRLGALRMQRVVGISLKRAFADQKRRSPSDPQSETRANNSWPWKEPGTPEDQAQAAPREFALLEELRKPGPWNEPSGYLQRADPTAPIDWDDFKRDVETERGLFKVAILYAQDRINWRETKTFREYLDAKESRKFEAGLDTADLLTKEIILAPLMAVLGVSPLAVGIALVLFRYGHRRATDTNLERIGDERA